MTENAEEYALTTPAPLQDANVDYERASALERQKRDALVATWRDWLHYGMQSTDPADLIKFTHYVMDSMDVFLNHAGGRRK